MQPRPQAADVGHGVEGVRPGGRRQTIGQRLLQLSPYLLYLGLTLPGVDKAFHLDDAYVLTWARHVQAQPLRPVDFKMDWHGVHVPVAVLANPPLHVYLLAALRALFGEQEAALHAAMLPFGLLAIATTGLLATRFAVDPLAARFLVAVSPVFVVQSQTVMPDVVAFALGSLGMALGFRAVDRDQPLLGLLAGLALGAASLTRYTALGLLIVVLAYPLLSRRRLLSVAPALAVVAAMMLTWVAVLRGSGWPTHLSGLGNLGAAAHPGHLAVKLVATASFLGGALVVPPLGALAFLPRAGRARAGTLAAAGASGALIAASAPPMESAVPVLLLGLLSACGLIILGGIAWRVLVALRRWREHQPGDADELALCLWMAGPLMVPIIYHHVAAKYLLPVLPALVILLLRKHPPGRGLLAFAVAGGAALSLVCGIADREHAELPRRAAREVVAPLLGQAPNLWFAPEWGYRIYLSRLGARVLTRGARPAPGDLVLVAQTTPPFGLPQLMGLGTRERGRYVLTTRFPIVLMRREAGAGFYSSVWGWLPYSWSRSPVTMDTLTLYEVTAGAP